MRNGDVILRLLVVFSVAGFLALAAGLYEIDRREKSSSATGDHNLTEVDLRIQDSQQPNSYPHGAARCARTPNSGAQKSSSGPDGSL